MRWAGALRSVTPGCQLCSLLQAACCVTCDNQGWQFAVHPNPLCYPAALQCMRAHSPTTGGDCSGTCGAAVAGVGPLSPPTASRKPLVASELIARPPLGQVPRRHKSCCPCKRMTALHDPVTAARTLSLAWQGQWEQCSTTSGCAAGGGMCAAAAYVAAVAARRSCRAWAPGAPFPESPAVMALAASSKTCHPAHNRPPRTTQHWQLRACAKIGDVMCAGHMRPWHCLGTCWRCTTPNLMYLWIAFNSNVRVLSQDSYHEGGSHPLEHACAPAAPRCAAAAAAAACAAPAIFSGAAAALIPGSDYACAVGHHARVSASGLYCCAGLTHAL